MNNSNIYVNLILGLIMVVTLGLTFCTDKGSTRNLGGKEIINLPRNKKLDMITWKDNNLWLLLEDMDSTYVPKTKYFKESSNMGVMEGTIIIKEYK